MMQPLSAWNKPATTDRERGCSTLKERENAERGKPYKRAHDEQATEAIKR